MPLITTKKCKCGAELNKQLKVCPECGAKFKMGWGKKILIGVAILAFIGWALPDTPKSSTPTTSTVKADKTPEQKDQEKADADLKAKQDAEAKAAADKADAEAKAAKAAQALVTLKSEAKTIPYKDLARNPDNYKLAQVKYTGKVIQVQEDGNDVGLRVNVTKGNYDLYTDTIFVLYDKGIIKGRVLEDDIITFYGNSMGLLTYKTVMGAEMTIPQVLALIVEVVK